MTNRLCVSCLFTTSAHKFVFMKYQLRATAYILVHEARFQALSLFAIAALSWCFFHARTSHHHSAKSLLQIISILWKRYGSAKNIAKEFGIRLLVILWTKWLCRYFDVSMVLFCSIPVPGNFILFSKASYVSEYKYFAQKLTSFNFEMRFPDLFVYFFVHATI